jgi:hypothetical protein
VDDIHQSPIGRLEDVWPDPATNEPRWLLVRTSTTGYRRTLVPVAEASKYKRGVWIRFDREFVRSAPTVRRSMRLTSELNSAFSRYYGIRRSSATEPEPEPTRAALPAEPPARTGFVAPRPSLRPEDSRPAAISAKAAFTRPGVQPV